MEDKYWIYEDYFIFKPNFNGLITDYLNLMVKYDKLIFSNYNSLKKNIII